MVGDVFEPVPVVHHRTVRLPPEWPRTCFRWLEADPDRAGHHRRVRHLHPGRVQRPGQPAGPRPPGAGLRAGDAVALLADNRHEAFETIIALGSAPGCWCPLNWHFTADEIAYILNDSGAKALVADVELRRAGGRPPPSESPGRGRPGHVRGGRPAPRASPLRGAAGRRPPTRARRPGRRQLHALHVGHDGPAQGRALAPPSHPASRWLSADVHARGPGRDAPDAPEGAALVNSPLYHGGPFLFSLLPAVLGATLVVRRKLRPGGDACGSSTSTRSPPPTSSPPISCGSSARRGERPAFDGVQPAGRLPHGRSVPARRQAADARLVGAGHPRAVRRHRDRGAGHLRHRRRTG